MSRFDPKLQSKGARVLGDPYRHIWLTRKVTETAGIDLDGALRTGELSRRGFARVVTRCRAAGCGGQCARHLQQGAAGIPEFCANKDVLRDLEG